MNTRSWRFATNSLKWPGLGALLVGAVSGTLWFAAAVAILLFRDLPDPALAGRIAADAFMMTYVLTGACAVFGLLASPGSRPMAMVLLVIVALLIFWVVPALRAHGAGWPGSFASLHASASLAHLALGLGSAYWSWRLLQDRSTTIA